MQTPTEQIPSFSTIHFMNLVQKAPLALSIAFPAYYSLGWAYKMGIMARIDQIAINVLCHFVGYAGVGAWMPAFQWHAAWIVRIAAGSTFGLLYTGIEKVCIVIYTKHWKSTKKK